MPNGFYPDQIKKCHKLIRKTLFFFQRKMGRELEQVLEKELKMT